ncbi:1-phosphatidylinositol 3-phosphate 5-kinase [Trichinella pseudospiralis]|uniref:1-phosphatidylinositol-3-phosphate 5-kinase n=2 Tax=Trichinella pseudospiralis TaxID=6337 RepID=A0A0V1JLF7_TRIPS|nr:1-phosphatidylinositol 3-phosphate 5-kinase [Trichinella pseudospiralis]
MDVRKLFEESARFDKWPACNKIYIMDRWQFHLNLAYEVLSFSDCVQVLLLNSLRASSSTVVIRVHVEKFKFQIIDDGDGMDQRMLTFSDEMPAYLKDVCKLADEVIIHSRPRGRAVGFKARYCAALKRLVDGSRTFSDCFFLKDAIQIQSRKCHGTTVTVQKLFSKTPVRQKGIKPSKELDNLKLRLQWISVKHPKVIIELHDESDRNCIFRSTRCQSLSESFSRLFFEIYPHQLSDEIFFENEDFKLSLWIGTEQSNTVSLQCIYWNNIPIFWQTELHTFKLNNGKKDSCPVFLLTIDTPLVECFMVEGYRAIESCYKWKRLLEAIESLFQKPLSNRDSLQNEKLLSKENRCLLPGCKISLQLHENFTDLLPLLSDEKRFISQTSICTNSTTKCAVEKNSNFLFEDEMRLVAVAPRMKSFEEIKICKETMKNISVIAQYDCKFVICRAVVESKQNDRTTLLLLFDQHAVSERVRLEQLLRENVVKGRIASARLSHPIEISFVNPSKWFSSKDTIERYGIKINFESSRYLISTVPICFARGKSNISQNCVTAKFLKSVLQQILEFRSLPSHRKLPPIFRRSFADWACRGAIRFGDRLTLNQCQNLICQLVECEAPFHCAHGRRSVVPLFNLSSEDSRNENKLTCEKEASILKEMLTTIGIGQSFNTRTEKKQGTEMETGKKKCFGVLRLFYLNVRRGSGVALYSNLRSCGSSRLLMPMFQSNRIQALDGGLNIAKGVMELVSSSRDGSRKDNLDFEHWQRVARPIVPNAESMSDSCLKLCAYGDLLEPLVQLAQTFEQISTTLIILQYCMIAISVIFFFATMVTFLILLQVSNRSPDAVVEKRTNDNSRSTPKRAKCSWKFCEYCINILTIIMSIFNRLFGKKVPEREASPESSSNAEDKQSSSSRPQEINILGNAANDSLMDYNRSEFRQCWMPDSSGKDCYECREKFTAFRRRHHCRICGQIFCYRCCRQELPGNLLGYTGELRVCDYCLSMVRRMHNMPSSLSEYMQERSISESDVTSFETPLLGLRLHSDRENVSQKQQQQQQQQQQHQQQCAVSDVKSETIKDKDSTNSADSNLQLQEFRNFLDDPEPDWLRDIQNTEMNTEPFVWQVPVQDAVCQQQIKCINDVLEKQNPLNFVVTQAVDEVPVVSETKSDETLDVSDDIQVDYPLGSDEPCTSFNNTELMDIFMERIRHQLKYILKLHALPEDQWYSLLLRLAEEVAMSVRPETKANNDDMNILRYVHVKTLRRSDIPKGELIYGTVCTKAVLRLTMLQRLQSPKILIVRGPIEYERISGKFCSMDPIIMQEAEHLRHVVNKILALQPDVLLVEHAVASVAADFLSQNGLTVLHNVKRSALERIARCTDADVLDSAEGQLFKFRMGSCGLFRIEHVTLLDNQRKTLCRFENCQPKLGCSVLLSGPCEFQLFLAKRVLRFLISVIYSARLEVDLLKLIGVSKMDIGQCIAQPDAHLVDQKCEQSEIALTTYSPFIGLSVDRSDCLMKNGTIVNLKSWTMFCGDCCQDSADNYSLNPKLMHSFFTSSSCFWRKETDIRGLLANYRATGAKLLRQRLQSVEQDDPKNKQVLTKQLLDNLIVEQCYKNVKHPFAQDHLTALQSCHLSKPATPRRYCVGPRLLFAYYYQSTDLPLGAFLEQYCFNQNYLCPKEGCGEGMQHHVRRFVRNHLCVDITVGSSAVAHYPVKDTVGCSLILLKEWCRECKTTSVEKQISRHLWQLSFATYLNYLFHGLALQSSFGSTSAEQCCKHCVFHDHVHFFTRDSVVVSFSVQAITLCSAKFASLTTPTEPQKVFADQFRKEVDDLLEKGNSLFGQMADHLADLTNQIESTTGSVTVNLVHGLLSELQELLDQSRSTFAEINGKMQSDVLPLVNARGFLWRESQWPLVHDSIILCMRVLATLLLTWNCKISDFLLSLSKKRLNELERESAASKIADDDKAATVVAAAAAAAANCGMINEAEMNLKKTNSDDLKAMQKLINGAIFSWPFPVEQHFSLPIGKVPVAVDEHKPSSIIAYALASKEYLDFVQADEKFTDQDVVEKLANFCRNVSSNLETDSTLPLEVQFSDSMAKFYCKIYFPRQFRMLRQMIFPFGESAFVRSLANCEPWQPSGGKSGAKFFRSLDRRFVLKQMSRFETQSFVNFAPHYFRHLSSACFDGRAVSLVKIFGVFRIGYRNSHNNAACKMDLVVMEYLFYTHEVQQVYDLKGSLRNRMVPEIQRQQQEQQQQQQQQHHHHHHQQQQQQQQENQQQQGDLVLLDENLLDRICDDTFYLDAAAKFALDTAIRDDTAVLSANHIMDYSLLVGVDTDRAVLVFGIVDYLRTYTWDKKIESWVKSVSASGQLPTVISPHLYRLRFIESMDMYFPTPPSDSANL